MVTEMEVGSKSVQLQKEDLYIFIRRTKKTINALSVPRVHTTFASRSFSVAVPSVWNSLSADIHACSSPHTFRHLLKTHCFEQAFSSPWRLTQVPQIRPLVNPAYFKGFHLLTYLQLEMNNQNKTKSHTHWLANSLYTTTFAAYQQIRRYAWNKLAQRMLR